MENDEAFDRLIRKIQENQKHPSFEGSNKVLHLALSYLNTNRQNPHWVCDPKLQVAVRECLFLFSFQNDNEYLVWFKKHLNERLQLCPKCIVKYHQSLDDFKSLCLNIFHFDPNTLEIVMEKIYSWDIFRLQEVLKTVPKIDTSSASKPILCAFYEILYSPRILHNKEIFPLFRNRFLESGFLRLSKNLVPGVISLLFSRDDELRRWACSILSDVKTISDNEFKILEGPLLQEIRSLDQKKENENEMQIFLKGLSLLLKHVDHLYFRGLTGKNFNVADFILSGLQSDHTNLCPSFLVCLHSLLYCYGRNFWTPEISPSEVIDKIFNGNAYKRWTEENTSNFSNDQKAENPFEWATSLLKTISIIDEVELINKILINYTMQYKKELEVGFKNVQLLQSLADIFSVLFSEYFMIFPHSDQSLQNKVFELHSTLAIKFDELFRLLNLENEESVEWRLIKKVFEYRLNLDLYILKQFYCHYLDRNRKPPLNIKSVSESFKNFWVYLQNVFREEKFFMVRIVFRACSTVCLIDKLPPKKVDIPFKSDFENALNGFVATFSEMLIQTQCWHLSAQTQLVSNPLTFRGIFSLVFSPILEISTGSISIIKSISLSDSVVDTIGELLRSQFSNTLNSSCYVLLQWLKVRNFGGAKHIVYFNKLIINTIFDSVDGLTSKDATFAKQVEKKESLKNFWESLWKFFTHFFIVLPTWPVHDKDNLVDLMRDTLDFCDMLINIFEEVNGFIFGLSDNDIKIVSANDKGSALAMCIADSLVTVSYWLKLTDSSLLTSVVKVICKMLKICKKLECPISQNVIDIIHRASITSDEQTILTFTEREDLFISLTPYLSEDVLNHSPFNDTNTLETKLQSDDRGLLSKDQTIGIAKKLPESNISTSNHFLLPPKAISASKAINRNAQKSQNLNFLKSKQETTQRIRESAKVPRTSAGNHLSEKLNSDNHIPKALQKLDSADPIRKPSLLHTSKSYSNPDDKNTSTSDEDTSESEEESSNGLFSLAREANSHASKSLPQRRQIQFLDFDSLKTKNVVHPTQLRRNTQQSAQLARLRLNPDVQEFYKVILGWNPLADSFSASNVEMQCVQAKFTYNDSNAYEKVFKPMLFHECWAQVKSAVEEKQYPPIDLILNTRSTVDNFVDIYFTSCSPTEVSFLSDTDICLLSKSQSSGDTNNPKSFQLCKIQSISRKKESLELCLRMNIESIDLQEYAPNIRFTAQKLFNATTSLREFAALKSLRHLPLSQRILDANVTRLPSNFTDDKKQKIMKSYGVNEPQAYAIYASSVNDGFTLIQGPPGTGKTKTILGMIGAVLTSSSQGLQFNVPGQTRKTSKNKILICAPSNAAIDEILLRIKAGVYDHEGIKFFPKVIRVGFGDSISVHAKEFTLEEQMIKQMELTNLKKDQEANNSSDTRKKYDSIIKKRDSLREDLEKFRSTGKNSSILEAQLREITKQKNMLEQSLDDMRERQRSTNRNLDVLKKQIQNQLLQEADIVCATLSASGHELLLNAGLTFRTVIIDEAAQAVELSSIIPLKYGCESCVMVGDPNQLPPTVLSKTSAKFGYSQSLYVRMFKQHNESACLLSIQYRMNPEISRFPSKFFYNSKLLDGPNMSAVTSRPWHEDPQLGIYRFFNVHGTEAFSNSKSLYNVEEASFILLLYERLIQCYLNIDFEGKIGVVTPYRSQVQQLRSQFQRKYGSIIFKHLDIHTVDGFQGQEKDIIIFSCVRSSMSGGIGFLQDLRRLNVALTRAKSSLYIVGNSKPLMQEDIFYSLIEDAKTRGVWRDLSANQFKNSKSISNVSTHLASNNLNLASRDTPIKSPSVGICEEKQEAHKVKKRHNIDSANLSRGTERDEDIPNKRAKNKVSTDQTAADNKVTKPRLDESSSSKQDVLNKIDESEIEQASSKKPGYVEKNKDKGHMKKSKKPKSKLALAAMAHGFAPPKVEHFKRK
ncbi:ATP-dependent RNA helicase Dbl8 [Schizosaccharomyces pombe]|uniref:Uncharacterized ATP-dependent helicase C29A10.10c n=1 Tax=Schizosaccharomyces pombe (strain 972 / ATCC 24843) TaxID=284812 RepID=YGSA_SCHPO|nr:putative tRNA-splicing endonuclease positive effector [Schizosaccharomyces pombe]O94387.1 RecName: Full=Uncharacterized ATP-dependent helicase C29A10.10c [Schizosaccharomyces pombe 972h-]CAA22438.1 tRNA-splicing endonuclease positive effector (predicted) [Schizosaccharomyces pombe]|eukprot:NP_596055.1 putative tRNA-splicing endonuclease positive effector [Schizosaccharomyces pombe]